MGICPDAVELMLRKVIHSGISRCITKEQRNAVNCTALYLS